jgi:hypothetical protein
MQLGRAAFIWGVTYPHRKKSGAVNSKETYWPKIVAKLRKKRSNLIFNCVPNISGYRTAETDLQDKKCTFQYGTANHRARKALTSTAECVSPLLPPPHGATATVGQVFLIIDASRSHSDTQHFSGRVISPTQKPLPDNTQHSQQTDIQAFSGILNHNPSK